MKLNQSTSIFNDLNEKEARQINSEIPLKYTTFKPTRYFTHEVGIVDARPKLTRKNEGDYPTTPLYGTAPYKLHGTPHLQKESQLIHGDYVTKNRYRAEEHNYFQNHVFHPNHITNTTPINTTGVSTRNVYRNMKF